MGRHKKQSVKVELPNYIGFRKGDNGWRWWDRSRANYGQFEQCQTEEMQRVCEAAWLLHVPVYYFGLMDDTIEEATQIHRWPVKFGTLGILEK